MPKILKERSVRRQRFMRRLVGEEGAATPSSGASKHVAPGRTDGKSGIDQTDMRVRMREGAILCGGRRDEMLGE